MKNIIKKRASHLCLVALVFAGLVSGCNKSDEEFESKPDASMTLTLSVPETQTATRALKEVDESEIKEVDVLVFNEADGTFRYRIHGSNIDNTPTKRQFKVMLKVGNERQRFVVFANLRAQVDAAVTGFSNTTTKAQVLAAIKLPVTAKWGTASDTFTRLPMWGESENAYVVTSTLGSIGIIQMLRSIARVDVGLNFNADTDTPQTLTNFTLTNVNVYHVMNSAQGGPNVGTYEKDPSLKAISPSVAVGAARLPDALKYTVGSGFGLVRDIYIPESVNSKTGHNERTCLVVGGSYKLGTTSWYRIDFHNGTDYYNILRNHRYKVNITSVDGPGYSSETDALNSAPMNITTQVIVWNEGGSEVVYDGQHSLSVSKDAMIMYNDRISDDFTVTTTHPKGWFIKTTKSPIDLATTDNLFSPKVGVKDVVESVFFNYPAEHRAGTIEFDIVAGNLVKKVKIDVLDIPSPGPVTEFGLPEVLYFSKKGGLANLNVTTNILKAEFKKHPGLLKMDILDQMPQNPKGKVVSIGETNEKPANGLILGSVSVDVFASNATISASTRVIQYTKPLTGTVDILQGNKDGTYTTEVKNPLDWDAIAFRSRLKITDGYYYVLNRNTYAPAFRDPKEEYWQHTAGFTTSDVLTPNKSYTARTIANVTMYPASAYIENGTGELVKKNIIENVIGHTVVPIAVMQAGKTKPIVSLPVVTDIIGWDATSTSKTLTVSNTVDQEINNYTLNVAGATDMISGTKPIVNSKTPDSNASPVFNLTTTPYRTAAPGSNNRIVTATASYNGFDNANTPVSGTWTIGQRVAPAVVPANLRVAGIGATITPLTSSTDIARITVNVPNAAGSVPITVSNFAAANMNGVSADASVRGSAAIGHSITPMTPTAQFTITYTKNENTTAKESNVHYVMDPYNQHSSTPKNLLVHVVQEAAKHTLTAMSGKNEGFVSYVIPRFTSEFSMSVTTTDPSGWEIFQADGIDVNALGFSQKSASSAGNTLVTVTVPVMGQNERWRQIIIRIRGKSTGLKATMKFVQDYGLMSALHSLGDDSSKKKHIYLDKITFYDKTYSGALSSCFDKGDALGERWIIPSQEYVRLIGTYSGESDSYGLGEGNVYWYQNEGELGRAIDVLKTGSKYTYNYGRLVEKKVWLDMKVRCILVLPYAEAPTEAERPTAP